jgi:hypothetical protein
VIQIVCGDAGDELEGGDVAARRYAMQVVLGQFTDSLSKAAVHAIQQNDILLPEGGVCGI